MIHLKQSTAVTKKLGPFLDEDDGKTVEAGLTIAQADIRLSKNGGAFAQTNNVAGATHDEKGFYGVPLNTTDTATLGSLVVNIHESGALPVWIEFMVIPANVYDSLYGADKLQVDAVEVSGDSGAADNLEADYDGTGYAKANSTIGTCTANTDVGVAGAGLTDLGGMSTVMKAEVESEANDALVAQKLDHLVAVADADDVVNDSILAKMAASDGDWSGFTPGDDSLEALRDRGDAAWAGSGMQLSDTIDGAIDVENAMKMTLAYCSGKIVRTGDNYAYRNNADGADVFVLTGASAGRTRS